MGYFVLICIVAAITGRCRVATGEKPNTSYGGSEELHLKVDNELRIDCYANGAKLQFSFPESTFLTSRSAYRIQSSGNGRYTFLRQRLLATDTGWYACAKEGIQIDEDYRNLNHTNDNVSWIYVYVNSYRHSNTFANGEARSFVKTLIAVAGSLVIVPCRPVSPKTYIELWQGNKVVNLEQDVARFDPKIGFILSKVNLVGGQALLRCKFQLFFEIDDYILRYADPKPTMFAARDEDLTLQEGDQLRIECSNVTKLSFLFPNLGFNSSTHEIVRNENGTSTFIRRSVVSDDTGWYGCGALDIQYDDIPDNSIDYTRKEIAWIYVYVNSSVPFVSGLVDSNILMYTTKTTIAIIPCKPTSPGSHKIYLNYLYSGYQRTSQISPFWILDRSTKFDPKVGFLVTYYVGNVYQCATDGPMRYVSRNYTIRESSRLFDENKQPVIADADDPLATQNLVIKMTGHDLRMSCEKIVFAAEGYNFKWTIPNTVPEERVRYISTRPHSRVVKGISFRKKVVTVTIMNVTESDSGEYNCAFHHNFADVNTDSRDVEVFDKSGGRYIRLSKKGGAIHVAGLKGELVKWLVDLTDFPSSEITWMDSDGEVINTSRESDAGTKRVRTSSTIEATQKLFVITNLTAADRGVHRLRTNIENKTAFVNVTVNVQEPPTISLIELGSEQIFSGTFRSKANFSFGECEAVGSLELNVTISFLIYPKFPSQENYIRLAFDDNSTICHQYKDPSSSGRRIIKKFPMEQSGLMICQACDRFGCNEAKVKHLHSVSEMPYFTSTNLNDSDVVVDPGTYKNESLVLECFVSGTPYPKVTWFRNNVQIREDQNYVFAHDNSELRIRYFIGDEGGQYKCRAENANGFVERQINVKIRESTDVLSSSVTAVIVLLLIIIVTCCAVNYRLLVKVYREKKFNSAFRKGAPDRFDPDQSVVDQAHLLPYHLKWEYPWQLLKLGKILGSGAFGIVKKAEAKSICRGEAVTTVAVKLVRPSASLNFIMALQRELKILAYLGKHPNVVNLLGACTRNVIYGELFVIVEYCRFGNLRDYLLKGRADFIDQMNAVLQTSGAPSLGADLAETDESGLNSTAEGGNGIHTAVDCGQSAEDNTETDGSSDDCTEDGGGDDDPCWASKYRADNSELDSEPISTRDLIYWSWQVSRAMDFLGKRKIVHGDLAARNILLSDNNIVKVCDFGLAKALCEEAEYRDTGANPLPYRWMAMESIRDRVFSYQSDVWSFGVVMWEFFTLGETPYPGIRHRGLLQKLTDGYRMEHPKYATTSIYDMMRQCWEADPAARPSFVELAHNLGDSLEDGFKTEYLEMHAQYMEMNAEIAENERRDYLALSLEPPSAPRTDEQIEMQILTRDRSSNPV